MKFIYVFDYSLFNSFCRLVYHWNTTNKLQKYFCCCSSESTQFKIDTLGTLPSFNVTYMSTFYTRNAINVSKYLHSADQIYTNKFFPAYFMYMYMTSMCKFPRFTRYFSYNNLALSQLINQASHIGGNFM